jgi:hypothetical protein
MLSIDVFKDKKAPGFILLGVVLKKYGMECLEYEPALLRDQIEKDYELSLTQLQIDKLQAAMAVMTTDSFYTDWRVFEATCHLFHDEPIDTTLVNPLDAEDIAIGLAEATMIKNDTIEDADELVFDDEVRAYAGRIFYEYGLCKAPKIFPTAIMPPKTGTCANDKDKNDALTELFDLHSEKIIDYVDRINQE